MSSNNRKQTIINPGKQPFRVYYFSIDLPVVIEGSIIDIETRGLEPNEANLTAMGHIKWNKLSAFVIHEEDEEPYQEEFREWVKDKVSRCPRPLIAYNKFFEEKWLGMKFDRDIQPIAYQAKDKDVDNFYGFKPKAIYISHLGPIIPNIEMLEATPFMILKHLVQDLYSELALYVSLAHLVRWKKDILPALLWEEIKEEI